MSSRMNPIAAALVTVLAVAAAPTVSAQGENWAFEISPYVWGSGIDADVTVANRSVEVSRDFGDLVEALDIGGGLAAGLRLNHFLMVTQVDYLSLDSDELDDAPARGDSKSNL